MGWHRATSLFAIAALGCLPARMAPPADAPDGLAADVPADAAPEADVPDDPAAEATDPAQGEAPDPDAPKPGSFLAPCSTGHDCDCGICVTAAGEDVCSRACDGGCPKGWQCRKAAEAGPEVCMPDAWALCRPCSEDQDCTTPWGAANRCVRYSAGGRFCGQDCALDTDCPEGFACLDAVGTDGKRQCRAVSGDCPCTPRYVLMQLTTTCSLANEHGTCYGRRRCEAVGLTPCDASAAAPEICDGLDNDCDGQVNEGLAACVVCGDGKCGGAGEDVSTCPYDCHQCGDHICSPGDDLDDGVCKDDCCQCPDGICQRFGCGEDATTCPKDCSTPCGNKTCDDGENVYSCPEDCEWKACGNGTCEGGEDGKVTPGYCAADCGTACGNCVCDKDENGQSCPADCGWCGDLVCSRCLKEDAASCAPDCLAGGCGDGACDAATEDLVSCPKDCGQAADA